MWEKALPIAELSQQGSRCWSHVKGRIGIFRTELGLHALSNTCPHYEAELHAGEIRNNQVLCPWHRWRFDLKTGHCATGPHFDIKVYPIKEEEGYIWIDVAAGSKVPRDPSTTPGGETDNQGLGTCL